MVRRFLPNKVCWLHRRSRTTGLLQQQLHNLLTVYVYLQDHQSRYLGTLLSMVEAFAKDNNTDRCCSFLLAARSAGIQAATNISVKAAWYPNAVPVYGAVAVLCSYYFPAL